MRSCCGCCLHYLCTLSSLSSHLDPPPLFTWYQSLLAEEERRARKQYLGEQPLRGEVRKPNCLGLRRPSGRRKYTGRYSAFGRLRHNFCGRNRVSGALRACFGPREQRSGSSRNLLILEGVLEDRLLQHRDALLKCTQGAKNRCAHVLVCGCSYIHHRHLL